jgi:hypothetical protein
MSEHDMSDEAIRKAATDTLAQGDNIRERVRALTLEALQSRHLDFASLREVMKSLTEGISVGAEQRGRDLRFALSEAFAGMDQALSKAAQASSLALKELASRSKGFSNQDLKQGLERMRQMEGDFLDAVRQVSQSAGGTVKSEWQELSSHAQRAGTDTGRVISQTAREFSARMSATMGDTAIAGMEAARQFGERFAAAASGILAGMSEALRPEPPGSAEKKRDGE